MSSTKIVLPAVLLLLAAVAYFYFANQKTEIGAQVSVKTIVKKGAFVVKVTATGELKAKRSEKIRGPQGMRSARIYQTTISDMVAEGTVVKKGDYVAQLDKSELDTKLKETQTEIEKIETQLEQAKIDTTIELRGIRDEIVNLRFAKEEKLLSVEQSKYEPQMVIQQAQIDLQRSERDYKQLISKYSLSQEKSAAKISEILSSLKQNQIKFDRFNKLAQDFIIKAPKDGMVIYARSWDGKVGPGSQISTWDPVVAELPDLSDMVSKTFVNEVDISKVKKGQDVTIKVDAFPDEVYSGTVIKVANIGETLKNYDSKVFEVTIQVNEVDSILRPAMTTGNEIVTERYDDVLSIPLEALYSDTLAFVYKTQEGQVVKQEVITGVSNENEIIVEHGLAEGDEIHFSGPDDEREIAFIPLDEKIKEEIRRKQEEDRKRRQAQMLEKMKRVKDENLPDDRKSTGGRVIIFN
ncbi:MAG: HlyD family secretion protein [Bacteroidota bacterium]